MLGIEEKCCPTDFVEQYQSIMRENFTKIKLMPGAQRLIEHLRAHGIPLAIATGSAKETFELKTLHLGDLMRKPFKHFVFAGSDPEVSNGKPHPDVYRVAIDRFEPPPKDSSSVLAFEDAQNGIQAALGAGAQAIFVPDSRFGNSEEKLGDLKPTLTLKSLCDFKPELFGLPPFP